jgi:sulfur-carrier protein adenylyltransferase/sulfurtransferase
MKVRELKLRKNPDCPICGENRTIHELIDYHEFCGVPHPDAPAEEPQVLEDELTVQQLKDQIDSGANPVIIDVREPSEFQIARLEGTTLIPLGEIPQRFQEIPRDQEVVLHCKMGVRSRQAVDFLKQQGFTRVKNLAGGITAWSEQIDPNVPKY